MTNNIRHFLVRVWGDVEPSLEGPFPDPDARLEEAQRIRREDGDEDGLYILDVDDRGNPTVDSFPCLGDEGAEDDDDDPR